MQTVTTIGLDIAKSVFQVHGVSAAGEVVSHTSQYLVRCARTPAISSAAFSAVSPRCGSSLINRSATFGRCSSRPQLLSREPRALCERA